MTDRRPVVAVVDDDPRLLESLENLLESANYVARSFPSAQSFLRNDVSEFDLLITDIGMPEMDGLQLRELVRMSHTKLPVFTMTGRHEIADQDRAQDLDRFFRKPLDFQALLAAIDEALSVQKTGGGKHAT